LPIAKTVDRFRRLTIWLILTSTFIAIGMIAVLRIRVDPQGASILECLIAALLLASRLWWNKAGHVRMADACGTVAVVALGGMSCGAIAMVGLREGFPLADETLRSVDHALGVDGIAVVETLFRQGEWIFWIMAPAYNFTIPIFFGGLVLLAWLGDRVEAWRAAFCFVGTLLITCLIAVFVPAKGIGVWAPQALLQHLPPQAMRSFWQHFDEFYFGADPVLRMQVVDGVVSFPSFHSVVGFLVLAMWRKRLPTFIAAAVWLAFMLLGTFPGGGHYFVDLVAGFLVWAAWFALSRWLETRPRETEALAPV
jgi:membrane-associated phospholipid phosphatase